MDEPKLNEVRRGRDIGPDKIGKKYYIFAKCPDCGSIRWIPCLKCDSEAALGRPCAPCRNRRTMQKRVGSRSSNRLQLIGRRFGRLMVIADAGSNRRGKRHIESRWKCRCDCGSIIEVAGSNLTSGNSTSCGCYNLERTIEVNTIPFEEYRINRVLATYLRTAEQRGYKFDLSRDEFSELIDQPCYYCGVEPSNVAHPDGKEIVYQGIDRKDNSLGYTTGNCVPCCSRCNYAKKKMSPDEFIKWARSVADHFSIASLAFEYAEGT